MEKTGVLVTGGAGYIGSHVVRRLLEEKYPVIVVDNLYSGNRWAVPDGVPFFEGDAGDPKLIRELIQRFAVASVMHFAGHIVVPESVRDPLKYYANNTGVSRSLIDACVREGVDQFIFSSSAAVYGQPERVPVSEAAAVAPLNPYGTSKLLTEWMLRDVAASAGIPNGFAYRHAPAFRYAALRYFNVAGASADGALGQATPEATHLIKVAAEVACGLRPNITIFGTDYQTRDGTCVRDYIHVEDLAAAHIEVLRYLEAGGQSEIFNCGYGRGYTVREVIAAIESVSEKSLSILEGVRRLGDPAELVSDVTKIQLLTGWHPKYGDIGVICKSAYEWEKSRVKKMD